MTRTRKRTTRTRKRKNNFYASLKLGNEYRRNSVEFFGNFYEGIKVIFDVK